MPDESDLRHLLQGPDPEGRAAIDLDAVLTRARRRRRPRVIAAQALGSVALVGVLGTAVVVSLPRADETASMIAQDTAAGGAEAESAPFVDQDDALKSVECGAPPATVPLMGWSVDVTEYASAASGEAGLTVTLGREAPVPESGTATVTALTLVEEGIVVGHAFPVAATVPVGPGSGEPTAWEDVTWDAVAPTESCTDPARPLPAGDYQVIVEISYVAEGGDGFGEPIRSALSPLEIR